jgi:hypothetical protein
MDVLPSRIFGETGREPLEDVVTSYALHGYNGHSDNVEDLHVCGQYRGKSYTL